LNSALPGNHWEFPGALADLIGDLMWSPSPIEIKLYSTDQTFLKQQGPRVEAKLQKVAGVVDTFDGLSYTGPSISLRVRFLEAERFGLTATDISDAVHTAMLGQTTSDVLEGDRLIAIRVLVDPKRIDQLVELRDLPIRTPTGATVRLRQVVDVSETDSQLELRREDLRQDIAVTARLEGRDLGSAMAEIRKTLDADTSLPPGTIEYGGLKQQQDSFRNLMVVLAMAIVLVFTVLLFEFRGFLEPVAIVLGATLAVFGSIAALWMTETSLNVVSFLGAIIGVGIVAKNGILMLDLVDHYIDDGADLQQALVRSGRRRLRPVLMTSMAAALGMLPLAYGIGSGADMLRPLAIAVIGALSVSVLLSLVATPTVYYAMRRLRRQEPTV
jgi:multidrug efflux pump subunit AcrB